MTAAAPIPVMARRDSTKRNARSWIRRADTLLEAFERREDPLPELASEMRRLRANRDRVLRSVFTLERSGTGPGASHRELETARRNLVNSWRNVVSTVDPRGSLDRSGPARRA